MIAFSICLFHCVIQLAKSKLARGLLASFTQKALWKLCLNDRNALVRLTLPDGTIQVICAGGRVDGMPQAIGLVHLIQLLVRSGPIHWLAQVHAVDVRQERRLEAMLHPTYAVIKLKARARLQVAYGTHG